MQHLDQLISRDEATIRHTVHANWSIQSINWSAALYCDTWRRARGMNRPLRFSLTPTAFYNKLVMASVTEQYSSEHRYVSKQNGEQCSRMKDAYPSTEGWGRWSRQGGGRWVNIGNVPLLLYVLLSLKNRELELTSDRDGVEYVNRDGKERHMGIIGSEQPGFYIRKERVS